MRCILSALMLTLLPTSANAQTPVHHTIDTSGIVQNISIAENGVVITLTNDKRFQLRYNNGSYTIDSYTTPVAPPSNRPNNILPDGGVVTGAGLIRRAWLSAPTTRYGHGVLGDRIEAGAISAELSDGRHVDLHLSEDAVFEDRTPRLVDLNNDGEMELLVVKSYLDRGAALTLVAADKDGLKTAAEAPAIGLSHRWLNPVGVADYDGDGINEVAAVITPHIGGTLQLYEWRGNKLVEDHAKYGFSNHQMGSPNQDLSVIVDVNSDGIPDMVLPDAGRGSLLAVTFAGSTFKTLFRVPLDGSITAPVRSTDVNGDGQTEIIFAAEPGKLNILSFAQ